MTGKSENKIKILVAYHKPSVILKSDWFLPIHVGRSVAMQKSKDGKISSENYKFLLKNMIGDDTGDNISDKNRYYCECTALYWAWKNYKEIGDPDYVGLMQYRRHFIFKKDFVTPDDEVADEYINYSSKLVRKFDGQYFDKTGLYDERLINESVVGFDGLVVRKALVVNGYSCRGDYLHMIPGVKIEDFDLMTSIAMDLYPEYKRAIDGLNGRYKHFYQMFVMRRKLYFEYMDFLFNILKAVENRVDFSGYSDNGKRTLGYLAEALLSVFVWKKQEEGFVFNELPVTFFAKDFDPTFYNNMTLVDVIVKKFKYKVLSLVHWNNGLRKKYSEQYETLKYFTQDNYKGGL